MTEVTLLPGQFIAFSSVSFLKWEALDRVLLCRSCVEIKLIQIMEVEKKKEILKRCYPVTVMVTVSGDHAYLTGREGGVEHVWVLCVTS